MRYQSIPDLSGQPITDQAGMHKELVDYVQRHAQTPSRRPIADHTRDAFQQAADWLRERVGRPLILDSCCGRGDSSFWSAGQYEDVLVIGVDKSADRLRRQQSGDDRVLLLQADVRDFWRLARDAKWNLIRHHIFYPNPYPKAAQLGKRWHASSSWPDILALGGTLELRTNFEIYAREWLEALSLSGQQGAISPLKSAPGEPAASLFEAKYRDRGQDLFSVTTTLHAERTISQKSLSTP